MKNDKKNELIIQEFAELDKEMFSLLCEESYAGDSIQAAISAGLAELIDALRTPNMYPIGHHAEQIANAVKEIYAAKGDQTNEIYFDDLELVAADREKALEVLQGIQDETENIDELLAEDIEENYEGKITIDKIKSVLKVVEDEQGDTEDDG